MIEPKVPIEIAEPILEIISYGVTFLLGIVAKWLQGKRKQFKSFNNEIKNDQNRFNH